MNNFEGIKYFKADSTIDNWGDPSKINGWLLKCLDTFRARLDTPIIVTSGFRNGDPKEHGKGLAVDIVVPDFKGHLLDLFLEAERFPFGGIGLYRDWVYKGNRIGGLHVDMRPLGSQDMAARWFCIRDGAEKFQNHSLITKLQQNYISLNAENLKLYGVI